jgi:hypothetical protein
LHFQNASELLRVDFVGLFVGDADKLELIGISDDDLSDEMLEELDEGEGIDSSFD